MDRRRLARAHASREGICHGDNWHRYWPIICDTEEYVYSEGLVRLLESSPDISGEIENRQTRFGDNVDIPVNDNQLPQCDLTLLAVLVLLFLLRSPPRITKIHLKAHLSNQLINCYWQSIPLSIRFPTGSLSLPLTNFSSPIPSLEHLINCYW